VTLKTDRVPCLDGIRGLAIGLVLCCHGFLPLGNLPNHPIASRIIGIGRLSWSGVDLFFVLSGFLIGGILLDAVESKRYFASFYIRRAHRILPLYGTVLAFVFLVPLLRSSVTIWIVNRIPLTYCVGFLQNVWMAKQGEFGGNILGVTWSLAVEEQFYLTLPITIRYLSRRRLWWAIGACVVAPPLLRLCLNLKLPHGPIASYVLMPCRADALGLGVAAALIARSPKLWKMVVRCRKVLYVALCAAMVAVLALLASGFESFTNQVFGLEYSLLAAFYFLLLLSTLTSKRLETLFSLRPVRYLGMIAYGLYLFHIGCISAVHALVTRIHPVESGWQGLAVSCIGIALATLLAAASWEYFEKPLIRRGHRFQYSSESNRLFPRQIPALTSHPDDGR
jgi:peptidoglycan/LPS O-acetylase OafA/YrhL